MTSGSKLGNAHGETGHVLTTARVQAPHARGPQLSTRSGDLLDALHRRVGLVPDAARERGLLLRELAEGGLLGPRGAGLLLWLLLPLVSPPGGFHVLPFRQVLLLQTQLRLQEEKARQRRLNGPCPQGSQRIPALFLDTR